MTKVAQAKAWSFFSWPDGSRRSWPQGGGTPGTLPIFKLTPSVAGSTAWTFGHPFKQGDVPEGYGVAVGGAAIQTDIRNRWPDGSAKYAFLSAVTSLSAGVNALQLSATASSPAGSPLSKPTVARNVYTVTLTAGSGSFPIANTFALDLADVLAVSSTTWSVSSPSALRTIPGVLMREDHFAYPTGLAQLVLYFYVRSYLGGAMEVEVVVQNGYLSKPVSGVAFSPAPTEQDYTISVVLNGSTTLYTQSNVLHLGHTAAGRFDWVRGSAECTPQHDVAYLRSTKTVPNYGYTSPADATLGLWKQVTTNMVSWFTDIPAATSIWTTPNNDHYGDIDWQYDGTGYHPCIGPLTQWEGLYVTTGDVRAWRATIGNAYQFLGFAQNIIDETTGLCPDWRRHASTTASQNYSVYRGPTPQFPFPAGGIPPPNVASSPPSWGGSHAINGSHIPATPYLAYILTGRWSFLTLMQQTAWCVVQDMQLQYTHAAGICQPNTDGGSRAGFWSLRNIAYAASISPTSLGGADAPTADLAVRQSFVDSLNNSASYLKHCYIDGTASITFTGTQHFGPNGTGWMGDGDVGSVGTYNTDAQLGGCTYTAGSQTITVSATLSGYPWDNGFLAGFTVYDFPNQGTGIQAGTTIAATVAPNVHITSFTVTPAPSANSPGAVTLMIPFRPASWWGTYWMYGIGGMCWGAASDIAPEGANLADVNLVANFIALDKLSLAQGSTTEYSAIRTWEFQRSAASYSHPYLTNASLPGNPTFFSTSQAGLGAAYTEYKTGLALNDANLSSVTHNIKSRESDNDLANTATGSAFGGEGYGVFTASVIAMAAERGMYKASARYSLITGYQDPYSLANSTAPQNFQPQTQGASDAPQNMIVPRAITSPSWY